MVKHSSTILPSARGGGEKENHHRRHVGLSVPLLLLRLVLPGLETREVRRNIYLIFQSGHLIFFDGGGGGGRGKGGSLCDFCTQERLERKLSMPG